MYQRLFLMFSDDVINIISFLHIQHNDSNYLTQGSLSLPEGPNIDLVNGVLLVNNQPTVVNGNVAVTGNQVSRLSANYDC